MTTLNYAVSGSLEVAGADDWVAVALTADETYQFTVTGLTNFASLILYPPGSTGVNQGTVAVFSPYGYAQTAYLTVTPTTSGTYYLDISDPGYAGSAENYTVTASLLGAPPAHYGDSPSNAGQLTIGGSTTGTLEYGSEHDWIAVALTANQAYEFTVTGLTQYAVLMTYAAGSTGPNALANATNATTYPGSAQTNYLTFTPTTSGTYYIDISDPAAAVSPETYAISGVTVADDWTSNPSHAGVLTIGGAITTGLMQFPGDHDWMAVALTANQTYEFTVLGLTTYANLVMYPPGSLGINQATSAAAYSGGEQNAYLTFTPTTTGTYYLDISDPGYGGVTYYRASVVAITDDYTDSPSRPGQLTVGGSTTGSLEVPGDHDWIAVALTANQAYQFTVTGLTDLAVLTTFAPGSTGLDQGTMPQSFNGYAQTNYLTFTPTQTGTYYLDISDPGNSGSAENYTVSAATVTVDYTDNPSNPGHLTVGGSTTGSLQVSGEHDWIAVTLSANQTYEFTVTGLSSYAALMTYAPGSTGLDQATNAISSEYGSPQTAYLTFTPTESGAYYLDISDAGYAGSPENYTVSVATVAEDYTNNPSHAGGLLSAIDPAALGLQNGVRLNGDAESDILFHGAAGDYAAWLMNDTAITGGGGIGAAAGYRLAGVGDFNGDGDSDLLFQAADGTLATWQLTGTSITGGGNIGNPGSAWTVVGVGDFNGDGKSDVLFRKTDGTLATWDLNGTAIVGGGTIGNPGPAWTVKAVGDFNSDGKSDVLFENANGTYALWEMNDTAITLSAPLGNPGAGWFFKGVGDFNGDGKTDILFENASGTYATWDLNGASVIGGGTLGNPGAGWSLAGIGDYNGDGLSDLLFVNTAGTYATWDLNDTAIIGGGTVGNPGSTYAIAAPPVPWSPPTLVFSETVSGVTTVASWVVNDTAIVAGGTLGSPASGWAAKAVADFTGTGESDVLFQDASGNLVLWQTNGSQYVGGGALGNPGSGYAYVGVGDFNGDGKADILFQNTSSGTYSTWDMSGTAIIGGGQISTASGYTYQATGDFNGDGKSDILFKDGSGNYAIWELNDMAIIGGGVIGNPGGTWAFAGVGDFNGDGKSDILFKDAAGDYATWDLNGTSIVGGGNIGNPGSGWTLAKIADLNGDGKSDLVFVNASGVYATWDLNDTHIIGGGTIGSPGTAWHIV